MGQGPFTIIYLKIPFYILFKYLNMNIMFNFYLIYIYSTWCSLDDSIPE